jgi:hypothetical protein
MSVTDRILTALTTVIRMNDKVEEMAGLMKEQQRRLDDLNARVIRLQTSPAGRQEPLAADRLPPCDRELAP